MQGIRYRYSAFYQDITTYPELAIFRRFTEEWAWMLYNQITDIHQKAKECNAALAQSQGFPSGATVFSVTDWHRVHMREDNRYLSVKVEALMDSIRKYSQDLCLAHAVAQLPDHSRYFTEYLESYPNLFENGLFGPTGEEEVFYKLPKHPDSCALKSIPRRDVLTNLLIDKTRSLKTRIGSRLRKLWNRGEDAQQVQSNENVNLGTFIAIMDTFTCLYVPLLLSASMFVVNCIQSTRIRIAMIGVFGTIFSISFKLLAGQPTRSEVFAATAAYSAVLSVFVGATSSDPVGR
ncbi:hypothetical protein K469DRAFT_103357 [Zopfia rhizophila CBS 207.26]|uniref:DUF6594 domain-containing protein n=1 Tax=Zopfia rhizophila CBS 207.26 TaxID=1314779 RepID=A0A6A6EBY0_9PEZI|nr:hypothetical protein K469DRAFT_103357 [Zopfia rhizophila CBS 207.26]